MFMGELYDLDEMRFLEELQMSSQSPIMPDMNQHKPHKIFNETALFLYSACFYADSSYKSSDILLINGLIWLAVYEKTLIVLALLSS